MEISTAEGSTEDASRTSDSGIGDRGAQLAGPTYMNATPSGEVQLRVAAEPIMNLGRERAADDRGNQEFSGQLRSAEHGLLHINQTHGVHSGVNNEQASVYGDLQTRVQRQAGMEAPRMDLHHPGKCPSTGTGRMRIVCRSEAHTL
jgi:hypothetical protein